MSISRRLLFVLLLALSLGANTLADEADNSRALLDQTLQYWQQGDLDGIVSLFQANFEQAALAMANAPALIRDNTTTDDEIKSVCRNPPLNTTTARIKCNQTMSIIKDHKVTRKTVCYTQYRSCGW